MMKTYDELLAERDALAAQLRMVRSIFRDDKLSPSETLRKIPFVIDLDSQQCLAEIQAEAVNGLAIYICDRALREAVFKSEVIKFASEYAAKIRNTGTWLRDENVNGGKRQGGE